MKKLFRNLLTLAGLASAAAPAMAAAPTWSQVSTYTPSGGPIAAGAAGTTLQGGWIDSYGSVYSINSSNQLSSAANNTSSANFSRPTSENQQDWRVDFCFIGQASQYTMFSRWNGSTSSTGRNMYRIGVQTHNTPTFIAYAYVNGVATAIPLTTTGTITFTYGTQYCVSADTYQNGSVTTLDVKMTNSSGTLIASATGTDSTSVLQGVSGQGGILGTTDSGITTTALLTSITTYARVFAASTTYTISGPTYGLTGTTSGTFNVVSDGTLASAVTVNLADNDTGTFSPSSGTLAANSSTPSSFTFTYTPSSPGAKTLTGTNTGGLTNGSAVYQSLFNMPVSSAGFHFSPANWWGDTGRGGSVYRAATMYGAYFSAVWTGSASPIAILHLPNTSSIINISYYLNGVLYDAKSVNGDIALDTNKLIVNGTNTLKVYIHNATSCTSGWNAPTGTNVVEVGGLYLDSASTIGTAPVPSKGWVTIIGDSITAGYIVDSSTPYTGDNALHSYAFALGRTLEAAGYDYSVQAGTGDGFLVAGCQAALYKVTSGTYSDSASRWNKVNASVSMLDSNGHLSAYGSTGTEPAAIWMQFATNDQANTATSDFKTSVNSLLGAYRSTAPNAPIIWNLPWNLNNTPLQVTQIEAAFNGYKTIAPTDSLTSLVEYGANVAKLMTATGIYSTDGLHPNAAGDFYIAPLVINSVLQKLTPTTTGTTVIQCNGAKSCAIASGSNLAGG